jgi:hypothetical protein
MNQEREEVIIRSFFEKRVQERVLFELFTPNRRDQALNRLCHEHKRILREKYMIQIPTPNSEPRHIFELLQTYGAETTCYSLSYNDKIDGKELPLMTALEHAVGFGAPSIISCIPNKLAYFEAEQSYGAPQRYILKRLN